MNRGEVWWVESPGDRRPQLILTRSAAIPRLDRVLAVPATTRVRGIGSEVALDVSDGMPNECVLTLDNVNTPRKSYFVERICLLSPAKLHEVCEALNRAIECS